MTAWTKLPPLEYGPVGRPNCGPKPTRLKLRGNLHPGFGVVTLTRDGENIVQDFHGDKSSALGLNRRAARDPEHDWRIQIDAPLWDATYQRQDRGWVLVAKGRGFA